ncbi:MAG: GIDE domain-containing protein [Pseudomonadota bacterium]
MSLGAWIELIKQNPEIGFFLLFLLGFSLFGFERFLRLQARRRLIEDTPTSRIRSAAQGYVELEGWAQNPSNSPIFSPLTHTECTWYRYKVEERDTDERGRTEWKTVRSGTSSHLFLLDDNTGECVIDPDGAIVEPAHQRTWQTGDYRYTEALILPLEQIYAIGWLKSYEPVQSSVHEWVRDKVIAWKSDPLMRRKFDGNGDGELDADEFELLRKEAEKAALSEHQQAMLESSLSGQTHLLNAGDPQGRPLILSTHPQSLLAQRLRRHAWLWLGGALLTLGGLLYFVTEHLPATMS